MAAAPEGSTAPAIDDVVELLKTLRLPHMRRHAPDVLATAKAQRWDPTEAIRALLAEELAGGVGGGGFTNGGTTAAGGAGAIGIVAVISWGHIA